MSNAKEAAHPKRKSASAAARLFVGMILFVSPGCDITKEFYQAGELPQGQWSLNSGESDIAMVGDIMTWDRAEEYLVERGADYPFLATAPLIKSAGLAVGNLEGPVAARSKTGKGVFVYKVPPWTLKGLGQAGFDLVNLANNHAMDCGADGIVETLDNLKEAGIRYFGAGRSDAEAYEPTVVEMGGLKVAFVGAMTGEAFFMEYEETLKKNAYENREKFVRRRFAARKNRPGTAVATAGNLARMITRARKSADIVIVQLHFGVRYQRQISEFQRKLAHRAVDAGAHMVVGHHAHTWQPVEVYRDTPIVYGLGNFAFGSLNTKADAALMARAVVRGKKLSRVELIPLYVKNKNSSVAFQPKVLKGVSALETLDGLVRESKPLHAEITIEKGRGILNLKH